MSDVCVSAGPKGVINDWRRFKLDSVDQTVPQSKRELLRQMSSPREDDKERLNRKVEETLTSHHTQENMPLTDFIVYERMTKTKSYV